MRLIPSVPIASVPIALGLLLLVLALPLGRSSPVLAASPGIVISQVYGGGGNSGAQYANKFVELFNRGGSPASLDGWSVQYASATGTGNFGAKVLVLPPASVPPGGYFLVALAGGANGDPLPTPDATGTINPAASSGKLIVAATATGLDCNGGSNPCATSDLALIVDLVGYGSSNFYEGSGAVPALSNTTAALRAADGCTDTDDNAADFAVTPPAPRNSASPLSLCPGSQQTPTPSPEPTTSPTPTPSPTPSATPTPTPTPEPSDPSPAPYSFAGFFPPVASSPAVNWVKAGSAVPLRFSVGGYLGPGIIAGGAPASRAHPCGGGEVTDALDAAQSPGSSGLTYDAATGNYTFVWKTAKAWAGSCRALVLQLNDGSSHLAEFAFH